MDSELESDLEQEHGVRFGEFDEFESEFEDEYFDEEEEEEEDDEEEEDEEELEDEEIPGPIPEEEPELAEKEYRTKRNNLLDFHNVKDLVNFLSKITLAWPEDLPHYHEDEFKADPKRINFPPSFYQCNQLEKVVLWHAENFRKQFLYKFPNRRPPLMAPMNECDCQKLFSTFIQPTAALGFLECYDPEACVKFFKDFLSPHILEPVPDPPTRIRSHVTVLKERQANAFEHAVVIVSLLIGAGYNAYVVDGYASKEVTTMCGRLDYEDVSDDKPEYFSDKFAKIRAEHKKKLGGGGVEDEDDILGERKEARPASPSKYRVKPKKQFKSKYEGEMERREDVRLQEELKIKKEREEEEWQKRQKPPTPDIMAGYRAHAWVLILPGIVLSKEDAHTKAEREAKAKLLAERRPPKPVPKPEAADTEAKPEAKPEAEAEADAPANPSASANAEGNQEEGAEVPEVIPDVGEEVKPGSEAIAIPEDYIDPDDLADAVDAIIEAEGPQHDGFFLEVFTGTKRDITDPNFHGIEAVFNHKNYWINLQPQESSCGELKYDLQDGSNWAKLLYEPSSQKKVQEAQSHSKFQDEEEEEIVTPELYITMPVSWTPEIYIPEEDYQRKFPGGKKMFEHNDAMVEVAAPFVNADGLVKRIIKFSGKSRLPKNLLHIEERFDKRKDNMTKRFWYKKGRVAHEYFDKGRKDALKEHIHVSGRNKAHYPRHLYYYSNAHPEGVYHRQVVHKGLVEHFENRHDFLYYRFIAYGGVLCRTLPPKEEVTKSKTKVFVEFVKGDAARKRPRRKIIGIIEKFHRNPQKEADDDIAEKHMLIEEGKFRVIFHYGDENYTRRSLEFFKSVKGFKKESVDFKPEDCIEYRVDPFSARTPMFQKYLILKKLQMDQIRSNDKAREAEDEVYQTVTNRVQEDWRNDLELDYTSQSKEEEKTRQQEMDSEEELDLGEIDFASPYLEHMTPKNKEEELALKQFILQNAKDRIVRQAEHIIASYQAESAKLKDILKTPPSVKDELEAQHQGFATFYDRVLCKMHIMEQRLLRLRAKAPGDYCSLLIKVLQHPLLNKFTEEEKLEKQRKLVEALMPPPEEKKADHTSCCKLDYVFKFAEKKKQVEEEHKTETGEEDEQPALMILPEEVEESTHKI